MFVDGVNYEDAYLNNQGNRNQNTQMRKLNLASSQNRNNDGYY